MPVVERLEVRQIGIGIANPIDDAEFPVVPHLLEIRQIGVKCEGFVVTGDAGTVLVGYLKYIVFGSESNCRPGPAINRIRVRNKRI
jgi:hypothetical protein